MDISTQIRKFGRSQEWSGTQRQGVPGVWGQNKLPPGNDESRIHGQVDPSHYCHSNLHAFFIAKSYLFYNIVGVAATIIYSDVGPSLSTSESSHYLYTDDNSHERLPYSCPFSQPQQRVSPLSNLPNGICTAGTWVAMSRLGSGKDQELIQTGRGPT